MKRVVWLGDSLERIRRFPDTARQEAGYQLERVQAGQEPVDWKPMSSVGLGVSELRIRAEGAFRVIFVAKFAEAIYVIHAFQKKGQKTAQLDVDLARKRFQQLLGERRQRWKE